MKHASVVSSASHFEMPEVPEPPARRHSAVASQVEIRARPYERELFETRRTYVYFKSEMLLVLLAWAEVLRLFLAMASFYIALAASSARS